jgi:hypothetical protein
VCLPHRPAVEGLERPLATLHIRKAAQPHEAVRPVEITELTDQLDADGLL